MGQDRDRLREDLEGAKDCLVYLERLKPAEGDDRVAVAETYGRRLMAIEDVKSRIKEIREEIADLDEGAKGG